jgi:hypothetical protein
VNATAVALSNNERTLSGIRLDDCLSWRSIAIRDSLVLYSGRVACRYCSHVEVDRYPDKLVPEFAFIGVAIFISCLPDWLSDEHFRTFKRARQKWLICFRSICSACAVISFLYYIRIVLNINGIVDKKFTFDLATNKFALFVWVAAVCVTSLAAVLFHLGPSRGLNKMNAVDPIAYFTSLVALAISAVTIVVMAFELWTWRRKSGRKRFALPVIRNEYNSDVISSNFANGLHVFITHGFDADHELSENLRTDLERIAVLAIGDDLIIDRTAQTVRDQITALGDGLESLQRFRDLTDNWMISGDASIFLTMLPSRIDPLRGGYEFRKKRLVLFRKIHQAAVS